MFLSLWVFWLQCSKKQLLIKVQIFSKDSEDFQVENEEREIFFGNTNNVGYSICWHYAEIINIQEPATKINSTKQFLYFKRKPWWNVIIKITLNDMIFPRCFFQIFFFYCLQLPRFPLLILCFVSSKSFNLWLYRSSCSFRIASSCAPRRSSYSRRPIPSNRSKSSHPRNLTQTPSIIKCDLMWTCERTKQKIIN